MIETLSHLDTAAFLFFNGMHAPWADFLFYWASNILIWVPLYLFFIFWLIKKYKKQCWIILPLLILVIVCTDQSCNFLKRTVQRPRPSHTESLAEKIHLVENPDGTLYYGGQYGFPSGHAANSIAFAWMVIFFFGKRRKWLIAAAVCWSLLLCYSRLYLGVHYPGDILCGLILGSCWSVGAVFLYFKVLKKRFFKEEK